ncbi:alpha/beta hydrolase family esterase [Corynebacterium riegelii]|uniref:alpha/beta hydrolase family esterase n=1 Tax=Corynebacterium riegelii TaxID=156976 RepID=UPI0023F8C3E3|nr:PHB depolymerase family esterase [Corynebacterium riegelii]
MRGAKRVAAAAMALMLAAGISACSPLLHDDPTNTPPTLTKVETADPMDVAQPWSPASAGTRSVTAAGFERNYIMSLPPGAHERSRLPVIFVFHGYKESAETIREYSGLDSADAIVVYMEGIDKAWAPAPYAVTTGEQDLAYVDAVYDQLINEFAVDRARVFAAGLSNGGGFAAYVGCQRPQAFTAVATVAGAFYEKVSAGCSAIPMKHVDFHGTHDAVINYAGGERHSTVYGSSAELMEDAARRSRCDAEPAISAVSPTIEEYRWTGCDAAVTHYRIEGGPHVWPGSIKDTSATVSIGFATRQILHFFGVGLR